MTKRIAPLLTIVFFLFSGSACVPPPPPPQPVQAGLNFTGPSCVSDGAGNTTLKVLVLQNGYTPSSYYPPSHPLLQYARPKADPNKSITPAMAADFAAAFAAAPPFFQQKLCDVDGIYVNPTGCSSYDGQNGCSGPPSDADILAYSWALKEGPTTEPNLGPQDHYHRYIAISAGAWSGGGHAPQYSDYEQRLLNQLLPSWPPNKTLPAYDASKTSPNTFAMAVLAALAHEYGHILWYDTFRQNGTPYDFSKFCQGSFFGDSWKSVAPAPQWRYFGDRSPQSHANGDVQIGWIKQVLGRGDDNGRAWAAYYLDQYYNANGHWASYFGTRSPDEDFVETFKFYVLQSAKPPLTNLPVMIRSSYPANNYDDDLPRHHPILSQPIGVYETKRDCFVKMFP